MERLRRRNEDLKEFCCQLLETLRMQGDTIQNLMPLWFEAARKKANEKESQ